MSGRGVLLLHGIGLLPLWNALLARDLRRAGHRPVLNWGYPRRSAGIAEVADGIASRLRARFPGGVPPLHLVGHSMGGLVLRKLAADGVVPAGGRLITIGSPHRGARKAELFGDLWLYRKLFGGAGQDLRPGSAFLRSLPSRAPAGTATVVSGTGRRGLSLLLPGDSDGVVEVESQRLDGAEECWVPHVFHTLQPVSPRVRRRVLALLAGPAADAAGAANIPE